MKPRKSHGCRRKWQKRMRLLRQYPTICVYCDKRLSHTTVTIDHVIPKAHGGANKVWNMKPACHECNQRKGTVSEDAFRKLLARDAEQNPGE